MAAQAVSATTAVRIFRAVPLTSQQDCQAEVAILAGGIVAALMQAKAVLGEGMAFDLCEGARIVLTYRPAQNPWLIEGGENQG